VQLARRLDYRDGDAATVVARFRADCQRHMDAVAASFAALFYGAESDKAESDGGRSSTLLAGLDDDPAEAEAELAALGFLDPRSARDHLMLLRDGAPTSRAHPRRKQLLLDVAPALLGEVTRAPDLTWRSGTSLASSPRSAPVRASCRCSRRTRRSAACSCGSSARASSFRRS
jgi:glutamine synthetase adenylyltransferase